MSNITNQPNIANLTDDVKISDAARAYGELSKYHYEFIIAKNRNAPKIKVVLNFPKSKFYHLCGLHDLKIDTLQSLSREIVFHKIISGIYEDDLFRSVPEFSKIKDRIACLIRLEEMLDSDDTVFKFNSHRKDTRIECDYIIKNRKNNINYFYMISEDDEGKFYGKSCFSRDATRQKDFSEGHAFYHILYKAKLTVDKNGKEINRTELFVADSFRKELEQMKNIREIESQTAPSLASPTLTDGSDSDHKISFIQSYQQSRSGDLRLSGQIAEAAIQPNSINPPLFDIEALINSIESLNEKIINVIHSISDSFKRSHHSEPSVREQPKQDRTPLGKEIDDEISDQKEISSEDRQKPAVTKSQKSGEQEIEVHEEQSRWINKMINSAKREANENNKEQEPKYHDKNQSL